DKVPGVVYGQGVGPIPVSVERRDLRLALTGPGGLNAVVNLTVNGVTHATVVKEIQRDPIRRRVRHVDFLVVDVDKVVQFDVPVILTGESLDVKRYEGSVDLTNSTLKVFATPRTVPIELRVEVSQMNIGDVITAADVQLPSGVELATDPATTVVTASATRATIVLQQAAAAEAAGEEPAEGANDE
ncbi:MAG: rplY, partial [Acidimicrobiia bacterium]|nr:rplY [Acidimicrobiia bacterium]